VYGICQLYEELNAITRRDEMMVYRVEEYHSSYHRECFWRVVNGDGSEMAASMSECAAISLCDSLNEKELLRADLDAVTEERDALHAFHGKLYAQENDRLRTALAVVTAERDEAIDVIGHAYETLRIDKRMRDRNGKPSHRFHTKTLERISAFLEVYDTAPTTPEGETQ